MTAPPRGHRGPETRQGAALQANQRWIRRVLSRIWDKFDDLTVQRTKRIVLPYYDEVVYSSGEEGYTIRVDENDNFVIKGDVGSGLVERYRIADEGGHVWKDEAGNEIFDVDTDGDTTVHGLLNLTRSDATIASGVITPTSSFVLVDTESAASTDDLDTITGTREGDILILGTKNSGRDVTVKHNTGNLRLAGGADFTLARIRSKITLIYNGSDSWDEISRSDNS